MASTALGVSCAIVFGNLVIRAQPVGEVSNFYLGYPSGSILNFTEICNTHGYNSEEHTVVTEDGYILATFRIFKNSCVLKRPPVLLMHGFLQSADAFLDPGPNVGLPYLLADKCFDVWVGNQRGNYYARRHTTMNADRDAAFWDFGVDEVGLYDIPATVDYILKYSKVPKLNYVGFSQGSGTFFIMCSEKPGYCDKVNLKIGLAPGSRLTNARSVILRVSVTLVKILQTTLSAAGYNEVLARGALGHEFLSFMCYLTWGSEKLCGTAESLLDSSHPGSITNDTLINMYKHLPAGASLKSFVKYGQSIASPRFEKFDYGESNLKIYGTKDPPSFNLSAVTVPTVIMYGRNDHLVDTKDVFWLVEMLPNVLESVEVTDYLWNHFDFTYSRLIPDMIFPKVHKYLLMYSDL